MRHWLVIGSFIINLAWFTTSYAANNQACGAVPTKKVGNDIVLLTSPPPKTSWIYFFKNKSNKSIFVDHPSSKGASAGWSSYLRAGHWSALALNKSNFTIHCSTIEPGKVITLDCSNVLTVCMPKNQTTKSALKGNFWLTEDKPWETFVKILEGRGVNFSPVATTAIKH